MACAPLSRARSLPGGPLQLRLDRAGLTGEGPMEALGRDSASAPLAERACGAGGRPSTPAERFTERALLQRPARALASSPAAGLASLRLRSARVQRGTRRRGAAGALRDAGRVSRYAYGEEAKRAERKRTGALPGLSQSAKAEPCSRDRGAVPERPLRDGLCRSRGARTRRSTGATRPRAFARSLTRLPVFGRRPGAVNDGHSYAQEERDGDARTAYDQFIS